MIAKCFDAAKNQNDTFRLKKCLKKSHGAENSYDSNFRLLPSKTKFIVV